MVSLTLAYLPWECFIVSLPQRERLNSHQLTNPSSGRNWLSNLKLDCKLPFPLLISPLFSPFETMKKEEKRIILSFFLVTIFYKDNSFYLLKMIPVHINQIQQLRKAEGRGNSFKMFSPWNDQCYIWEHFPRYISMSIHKRKDKGSQI